MEVIIGVIIGGVIGYVAAITTLVVEHRRWKKEFKLQYLIMERIRREEQCDKIIELFKKGLLEDEYHDELTNMLIRIPKKVKSSLLEIFKDRVFRQPENKQKLCKAVSLILGAYLYMIDKQIEELTQ